MKFLNQLKASFLLVIMLLSMMHNAYPHVHNEHTEQIADSHHHHHDSDHHHHSEDSESDDDQKTIFDFLFKNHSHSNHTHQYTLVTVEHVKKVKQLEIKFLGSIDLWQYAVPEIDIGLRRYVFFNDLGSKDAFLFSRPFRGPPSLG